MAYEKVFATKAYIAKTIDTGELTLDDWGMCYYVDGEGGIADELATITGGIESQIIVIKANGVALTVKHGTGNIALAGSADFVLSAEEQLLLIYDGADWRDIQTSGVGDFVLKSLYDADSVVTATADDTPIVTTLAEQTVLGRLTGGHPDDIAIGIADNNIVQIDDADAADNQAAVFTASGIEGVNVGIAENNMVKVSAADVADDEYARFTASGLESRTAAEVATDLPRGIGDNALVEIDGADIADNEYARFTANGLESRTVTEVLTDLFGSDLPENVVILIENGLTHDGDYSGLAEAGVAGATLAFGDLCYLQETDGRWELADCGVELAASAKLGICVLAAANDGSATRMLLRGNVRADTAFPDLTHAIGLPVYMGETAGDIVTTLVTTASHFVRIIGHGNGADELTFNPSNEYIQRIA